MPNNDLSYTLRLKDLFSKTLKGASKNVEGLDSKMKGLNNSFGGLKNLVMGGTIGAGFISFGKAVFDSLVNYEYFSTALRTLMNGDALASKALEGQLISLAKTTPFELTEVQDATKQLLAYGFKAGDVVDTMRTLGDVSAGVGAPLGDIAYLYGTLKTQGKAMTKDMMQFAGRGIPIQETLAKRFKTTTKNISEMVTQGKIGFKDIEGAFKDMTREGGQFFNLMADQSKTVGGRWSNIADTWEQIKVNIGNSQTGIINSTLDFIGKMADALNTKLSAQNKMDEAFKRSALKMTFWEKLQGNKQGMPAMINEMTAYQMKLQAISDSNMANDLKAFAIKKELNKLDKERASGVISLREYELKAALLGGAVNSVKGLQSINSMKENKSLLGGEPISSDKSTSKSLGTGTEVTGQRPQAINISINKLVESLNVQTTNLTEGTAKIKELVSKALLEAVNDANLTAMA